MSTFHENDFAIKNFLTISSNAITDILINQKFCHYTKINLASYDYLAGAVLVGDCHWNLFFASVKNKTMAIIDPFEASKTFLFSVSKNWK